MLVANKSYKGQGNNIVTRLCPSLAVYGLNYMLLSMKGPEEKKKEKEKEKEKER